MASGSTLLSFEPPAYFAPAAAYPTFFVRNTQPLLQFSNGASAYFAGVLPRHYAGGGITCRICWESSGNTGTCTWAIAVERHDPATSVNVDSFAAAVNGPAAACNAAALQFVYTDVALTNAQIDGLLAGEHFRMKVTRAAGTITGDAELIGIELRET